MSSQNNPIDWNSFLGAVEPGNPTGQYLRYEGTYDAIKEARRSDDPALNKGEFQKRTVKRANWKLVVELCTSALKYKSKDLKLAAWLTEAWLLQEGVIGLCNGLKLIVGLCETFWDALYPALEPNQSNAVEMRLAVFAWMDAELPRALRQVQLTKPEFGATPAYSWMDWEYVLRNEKFLQRSPGKDPPHDIDRQRFTNSAGLTAPATFEQLHRDLEAALAKIDALKDQLRTSCGEHAPGFRNLVELLKRMSHKVSTLHHVAHPAPNEPSAAPQDQASSSAVSSTPASPKPGVLLQRPIQSRAEAYLCLTQAADYLLRTEPHSPVPFLVKRAIQWGDMSLDQLLMELLREPKQVNSIFELLGIQKKK